MRATLSGLAAVLAFVHPTGALGQTTAPPVTITSLDIEAATAGNRVPLLGAVRVAFVNHAPVVATEVDFALIAEGSVLNTYVLSGTFSPGVTIRHAWSSSVPYSDQSLVITKVTLANGSVWTKS